MVGCEIDLRVAAVPDTCNASPMERMGMAGGCRKIVLHERIVLTELFDDDWTGGDTLNTAVLVEQNGKTTLTNTVRHSSRDRISTRHGTA
jgi:uncharacterized protein YndB with AHSA1/START domain